MEAYEVKVDKSLSGGTSVVMESKDRPLAYDGCVVVISPEGEKTVVENGARRGLTREQALAEFTAEFLQF